MTANRVSDFETWVRSVERRVIRLERRPSTASSGGGGGTARGAHYHLPFVDGEGFGTLPDGVSDGAYVVGSLSFWSGEEVGVAVSLFDGVAYVRAAVSDGDYDVALIFVEP